MRRAERRSFDTFFSTLDQLIELHKNGGKAAPFQGQHREEPAAPTRKAAIANGKDGVAIPRARLASASPGATPRPPPVPTTERARDRDREIAIASQCPASGGSAGRRVRGRTASRVPMISPSRILPLLLPPG